MRFSLIDGFRAHGGGFFRYSGVAGRREYLMTVLAQIILVFVLIVPMVVIAVSTGAALDQGLRPGGVGSIDAMALPILLLVAAPLLFATVAIWLPLAVRRMRDATGSGWWYLGGVVITMILSSLAPSIDSLVSLAFFLFMLLMPSRASGAAVEAGVSASTVPPVVLDKR